jgi:hypothetical protein
MDVGRGTPTPGPSQRGKVVIAGLVTVGATLVIGAVALGQGGPSSQNVRAAIDPSGTGSVSPANVQPPTVIVGGPTITKKTRPVFSFAATTPGSTFRCWIDGRPLSPCTSPLRVPRRLRSGKHRLTVQAVDPAGLVSTPITYKFRIVKH